MCNILWEPFCIAKLLTQIKNDTLVHFLDFLKFYDTQKNPDIQYIVQVQMNWELWVNAGFWLKYYIHITQICVQRYINLQ